MLRALFDESCTAASDRAFVITGWIADVDEWDGFGRMWFDCLNSHPRIEYFSHHEAISRERGSQFFGFSEAERDKKVMSLVGVICESQIRRGILSATPHAIFANAPKKLRGIYGTKVYEWAFHNAIATALHVQLTVGEAEVVDFVFDGRSDLPNCIKMYEEAKPKIGAGLRRIAGTVTPGDDKDVLGLQAADLLAGRLCYNVRKGGTLPPFKRLAKCKTLHHSPAILPAELEPTLESLNNLYSMRGEFNEIMKSIRKGSSGNKKQ